MEQNKIKAIMKMKMQMVMVMKMKLKNIKKQRKQK